jgi:hypothetical protein
MEHQREEPASGWRERNWRQAGERDGAPERSGRWRWARLDYGAFNQKLWGGGEKCWVCFIWCFDLILGR